MADDELYEMDFQMMEEDQSFIEDPKVLRRGFEFLKEQAYPAAIGNHVLALNMEDNAKPYALLPKMIEKMNAVIDDAVIMEDTLDDYVDQVIAVFDKQQYLIQFNLLTRLHSQLLDADCVSSRGAVLSRARSHDCVHHMLSLPINHM